LLVKIIVMVEKKEGGVEFSDWVAEAIGDWAVEFSDQLPKTWATTPLHKCTTKTVKM